MILNNESTVMNNVICQRTSIQSQLPDLKKGGKKKEKEKKIQLSDLLVFCFVPWQKNKHFAVSSSDNETLALTITRESWSRCCEIKAFSYELCKLCEI